MKIQKRNSDGEWQDFYDDDVIRIVCGIDIIEIAADSMAITVRTPEHRLIIHPRTASSILLQTED